MAKTDAERSREYRRRNKEKKEKNEIKIKKPAKSSTDRVRELRARRKILMQQTHKQNENDSSIVNDNVPGLPDSKIKMINEIADVKVQTTETETVVKINMEISNENVKNKKRKVSELDKFKRRLIRAIARLLYKENKPEEEIWNELKTETGCDCELLWSRMRALTIKKLVRLFTAEDKIENITKIAQLSVTDWLLYDLVLVHEKVDVIGQELGYKEEPEFLRDLFDLVEEFNIEQAVGEELSKMWFDATAIYNNTGKRQCSPMLLQKRWYQLKESSRNNFYNFWFQYRGDSRKLEKANEFKPSDLQLDIVKRYKEIVMKPFVNWEELIKEKRVALPEDFERLRLAQNKITISENEPDLQVTETEFETIDLEEINDLNHDNREGNDFNIDIVKIESLADHDDDVSVLESVHIPLEESGSSDINSDTRAKTNGSSQTDDSSQVGSDSGFVSPDGDVPASSWLFRKPKVNSYNSIQLCKNPDFNTRLKRLSAAFYISERNRLQLNQCKPLTVDLHKTFEAKLINNTLYLKKNINSDIRITLNETISTSYQTEPPEILAPSIDNENADDQKISIEQTSQIRTERNSIRVINLPDIVQIRRVNQELLVAEVSPIQVSNPVHEVNTKAMNDLNTENKPLISNMSPLAIDKEVFEPLANVSQFSLETDKVHSDNDSSQLAKTINIDIEQSETLSSKCNVIDGAKNSKEQYNKCSQPLPKNKIRTHRKHSYMQLSWLPKPQSTKTEAIDCLLAADTVERILILCKTDYVPPDPKVLTPKRKKKTVISDINLTENQVAVSKKTAIKEKKNATQTQKPRKKKCRINITSQTTNIKIVCCWSRQKIENYHKLNTGRHYCPKNQCVCCCKGDLETKILAIEEQRKRCEPIILSDDESLTIVAAKKHHPVSKVTVGTNIDYDKDFEEQFADSLNLLKDNANQDTTESSSTQINIDSSDANIFTISGAITNITNEEKQIRNSDSNNLPSPKQSCNTPEPATTKNSTTTDVRDVIETSTHVITSKDNINGEDIDNSTNNAEDASGVNKKTILSDLMEMSGISADDINIGNNDVDLASSEENGSNIVIGATNNESVLMTQQVLSQMDSSTNLQREYVNIDKRIGIHPITNNIVVRAALLRWPELNIVSTHPELKFAYENGAQFFKMNVLNGIIVPIDICFKKDMEKVRMQARKRVSEVSKSVIDLTNDNDVATHSSNIRPTEPKIPTRETNESCVETSQTIQPDKTKDPIKPIKLFKAINPSILRYSGRSLLVRPLKKSTVIENKIIGRNGTQTKQGLSVKNFDADNKPTNEIVSDAESDEEPLAKKAKRLKDNLEGDIRETYNPQSDMINDVNGKQDATLYVKYALSRQLEPIVFDDNNGQSSDEDCILGV